MNTIDAGRVQKARRRLHKADDIDVRHDPAVRIVALDSPNPGESRLVLHLGFAVIAGLSEAARAALIDTIDGLAAGEETLELLGQVELDGVRRSIPFEGGDPVTVRLRVNTLDGRDASVPRVASTEAASLEKLVGVLETSVSLTSAELRGASALAQEIRSGDTVPPDLLLLDEEEHLELIEALEGIAELEPDVDLVRELEQLVTEVSASDTDVFDRVIAQYEAAVERLQPTDSSQVRTGLEEGLREARFDRESHDAVRRRAQDRLVSVLDRLGLVVPPHESVFTAGRILAEVQELRSIRRRLATRLERAAAPAAAPDAEVDAEALASVEARRGQLQRRRRSQQQLLAAARDQLAAASNDTEAGPQSGDRTTIPVGTSGRPFPIFVEEPLTGVPIRLAATVLSVLLRLSAVTQVVCATDEDDLEAWCASVGDRAGRVVANGWFAGEGDPC